MRNFLPRGELGIARATASRRISLRRSIFIGTLLGITFMTSRRQIFGRADSTRYDKKGPHNSFAAIGSSRAAETSLVETAEGGSDSVDRHSEGAPTATIMRPEPLRSQLTLFARCACTCDDASSTRELSSVTTTSIECSNVQVERHVAALSQPVPLYPQSSIPSDAQPTAPTQVRFSHHRLLYARFSCGIRKPLEKTPPRRQACTAGPGLPGD
jgi:hypothetical protein